MNDVIIIGAGAAGLMAARELVKAGKKVIVLEARNRTGGRIHTSHHASFFEEVELGAEFIHGNLPVTLALLDEAGIGYTHAGGEMWRYKNGKLSVEEEQMEGWDLLMDNLMQLKEDISISNFLDLYFPGETYQPLKKSVLQFVAGYDTADPDKASAFALRKEWQNEDDSAQHRVKGGYCRMIDYLVKEIRHGGGNIYLNAPVKTVYWGGEHIEVSTATGDIYKAAKVLIALPLGILQLPADHEAHITFNPAINAHYTALQQIGFGAIIKILLRFDEQFWENAGGQDMGSMGFLFSDEKIPTWWSQAPEHLSTLTGWLGGGPAREYIDATEEELFELAIKSLSNIFGISVADLKDKLVARNIINWTADPYTRGSYAYDTVYSAQARSVLSSAVANKLFFAGEYLYEGPSMGTVEAALTSGKTGSENILSPPAP